MVAQLTPRPHPITACAQDITTLLAGVAQIQPTYMSPDDKRAALDARWEMVRVGMAAGSVSVEQARVITNGLDALPDRIGAEVLAQAEVELVKYAAEFRPSELRRIARHILEVVAPEIAEAEEAKRLQAEEQAAREKCRLSLKPLGDGPPGCPDSCPTPTPPG